MLCVPTRWAAAPGRAAAHAVPGEPRMPPAASSVLNSADLWQCRVRALLGLRKLLLQRDVLSIGRHHHKGYLTEAMGTQDFAQTH